MALCKKCQAELDEQSTICPVCGADNAPEQEDVIAPAEAEQQAPIADEAEDLTQTEAEQQAPNADETEDSAQAEAEQSDPVDASDMQDAAEPEQEKPAAPEDSAAAAAPKKKTGEKAALITIGALVVAILAGLLIWRLTAAPKQETEPEDQQTQQQQDESDTQQPIAAGEDTKALASRDSYAVSADQLTPDSELMDKIVASVGDEQLTNGVFQIYYWRQYLNLMNQYGQYLSLMGLDTTQPLSSQDSFVPVDQNDENSEMLTWEQYFINLALSAYRDDVALATQAKAAGMSMMEEGQEYLDNMDENLQQLATQAGLDSAEAYVQANYGTGTTVEDYRTFMQTYFMAYTYAMTLQDVEYTKEDVEAYFEENADTYAENGIEKDDRNMVNVRHILIKPELDVDTDDDGEMDDSSDEAWAAAEEKANELYKQWQEDPTEDNFSQMATENSEDEGSAESGGLYESVYPGQMVEEFENWCFDASRQPGDSGVVKTEYGYHIMYFVSEADAPYWYRVAENDYTGGIYSDRLDEAISQYEVTPFYDNISVNEITEMG